MGPERTPDPDCFAKKLLASREIAQKGGLPFMITEYKDGLQGGPGCAYGGKHGDMAYAAAFIIHVRTAAPLAAHAEVSDEPLRRQLRC